MLSSHRCISIAHTHVVEPAIQPQTIHGPDMGPEREGSNKVFIVIIWTQQEFSSSSRSLDLWKHHMLVINHTLLIESFLMMCQESSSFPPSNRKREHKSARNPFHHYHSNSHSSTTQRVCRPAAPPSQPGHAITTSFIAMLQQPSDESLLTVHPQTVPDPWGPESARGINAFFLKLQIVSSRFCILENIHL